MEEISEITSPNRTPISYFKSSLPMYKYKFKLVFDNFSGLSSNTKLCIPHFFPIEGEEWYLELQKSERFYVYLRSKDVLEVQVDYETSICDVSGKVYHFVIGSTFQKGRVAFDLVKNLPTAMTAKLQELPDDVLIVHGNLKFFKPSTPVVKMLWTKVENSNVNAVHQMLEDMKLLFENATHSDIIFQVDGVSIKAHKAIVCSRSPMLLKMFEHQMIESKNNIVHIKDVSASIMQKFISLLYYPNLVDLDFDTVCGLYYVTDKYCVLSLRDLLGKKLLDFLREDNALRILSIANQHNDDWLVKSVMQYVKFNFKTIANSDSWSSFFANNFKLASNLMLGYFNELDAAKNSF